MNRRLLLIIGGIVGVVVVFIIGAIGSQSNQRNQVNQTPTSSSATQDKDVDATITYTGRGFEPAKTIVQRGKIVRVRNRSVRVLQFASAPYTDNSYNPELNIGTLNPSDSKTIYLTQKGTWQFLNNLDPSEAGTLIVR